MDTPLGNIGMCGPKCMVFLAILVRNRVWCLHSGLKLDLFIEEASFSSLISPWIKSLHNAINIGLD